MLHLLCSMLFSQVLAQKHMRDDSGKAGTNEHPGLGRTELVLRTGHGVPPPPPSVSFHRRTGSAEEAFGVWHMHGETRQHV